MILFDAADQLAKLDPIVAGPTLRLPDRAVGRSSSPLPDYETSQAQHERATALHIPKEKTDKRFWRATLCALCVYVVISAALGIPFIVMRLRKSHHNRPPPWIPPDEDGPTLPKQNLAHSGLFSLDLTDCNSWNNSEDVPSHSLYTAIASHSFAPSGTLSVRSNISHEESNISGNLTVAINPDYNASSILFQVFLEASSPDLRQRSFACFADEGSARGLSLYFPQTLDESSLSVHIVLLFPQSSASLSSFETYLPMFSQSFLDLSDVSFGRASIEGYKKDISCDFLQAPRIKVKNALAAINGSFNATENLTIDTVGGPISGHMILVQGEGRTGPTFFSLDTGNSDINANITFQVTSDFYGHKKFMGSVKNFGGPLNLDLWHESSTPPVSLDLYVQNNQAPSNVTVDANFVGIFDVQTKLALASVKETAQAPIVDSTGEVIYRNYVYDQTSTNRVKGWVGWGARKTGWDFMSSRIEIASSLSPVELTLGS